MDLSLAELDSQEAAARAAGRPLDSICIAQAELGVEFRKRYEAGKGADWKHSVWVLPHLREVASLEGLAALLERVATDPRMCVIRGLPVEGFEGSGRARRRHYHDNLEPRALARGDLGFRRAPGEHRWLLLDVDKVAPPEDFPERPTDAELKELVVDWIPRNVLPPQFAAAALHWRLSASWGMRPWREGVSVHYWAWVDRPVDGRSVAAWLAREKAQIDAQVLRSFVQPHYVAPPLFVDTPLPRTPFGRSGLRPGPEVSLPLEVVNTATWTERERLEELRVAAAQAEWRYRQETRPASGIDRRTRYVMISLERACADIVAAGVGQRHDNLQRAAYRFGRKVAAGELPESLVERRLIEAGRAALPEKRWREVARTVKTCLANGRRAPRASEVA